MFVSAYYPDTRLETGDTRNNLGDHQPYSGKERNMFSRKLNSKALPLHQAAPSENEHQVQTGDSKSHL